MPPVIALNSRRVTPRASHLRQFSNGSADLTLNSRPATASDASTLQQDTAPVKDRVERRCTIWVHDEGFSKDEVVLNLDLFPDVKPGELMAILALKTDSGVRDFQEKPQNTKKDMESLAPNMQRERSDSQRSPIPLTGSDVKHDVDLGNRYLFAAKDMPKEMKAKQPNLEISVAAHIASVFSFKRSAHVLVTTTDPDLNTASHVELSFKDQYLARSDLWRLALGELGSKTVYKGQKVLFMGTIKAQVSCVYVDGRKVQSAFFSTNTKPIFRSESARYVLFIQMSREMWDFDSEGSGEIMFNKVVNGFLPALFKKWAYLKAKHLVSIVLFTRVEYDTGITSELAFSARDSDYHTGIQTEGNKRPYKDFYRVVVSEMASGSWTTILYQLKREFKFFRKDISMHRINTVNNASPAADSNLRGVLGTRMEAEPSLAMHGNVLEAINLASTQFAHDYIDRDLMRTGISVVVITPCPGIFEVDYETLRLTTENLINNGIGIDLVCLPKMPLHSVPIFKYRNPQYTAFQDAVQFKSFRSEDSTPRQNGAIFGSSLSSLNGSLSPVKTLVSESHLRNGSFTTASPPSEWSYAIPHWIDVSFWTDAAEDSSNESVHPAINACAALYQGLTDFEVRCKMYEMEMASVMENVMTEIAVTPLQHDTFYPKMVLGTRKILAQRQYRDETYGHLLRDQSYTSLVEFIGGPSKALLERHPSHEEKVFHHTLDVFDVTKSEVSEESPTERRSNEVKKYMKTGSAEATRRAFTQEPKSLSSSFGESGSSFKAVQFLSTTEITKAAPVAPKARKASTSSTMTTPVHISPKPPKFGRQISLGKHGFGIAAPKASTADVHIEHASAAKPISTNSNMSGSKKKQNNGMTDALNLTASQGHVRPSSSQSNEKPKVTSDTPPPELKLTSGRTTTETIPSTRPMTIKSALQSLDSTNQFKSRSVLGSLYEIPDKREDVNTFHSVRADDNQKVVTAKLLAGSVPELPATLSPTTALSPWLSILNPSNPSLDDLNGSGQYRRWQHVFPRPVLVKTMKWKSLCSPASVPLTTEYFPTRHQLDTEYQQKPYNVSQNVDDELSEDPKTREEFLKELIGLRLSQGFQVVVGPAVGEAFGQKALRIGNIFDPQCIAADGASVFMSMGSIIHQLSCGNEGEIEVRIFVRKPTASTVSSPGSIAPTIYNPAIRTTLADDYESRQIVLGKPKFESNWNYVDAFTAGFVEEMSEGLRFWRARFVLIPVERPTMLQRRHGEDNEEEIRLEGIKKLTQMWQRHRIVPASERRFQNQPSHKSKDPNPLDIVYKTEDPSFVVTAELETLPLVELGEQGPRRGQLLETERFRRSKLDIAGLAEAIQAPIEKGGVRMQNRHWHFRLHYNCFIGSDMTTWLIENFEDIDTREEAIELGNKLMAKDELQRIRDKEMGKESKDKDMGIFVHVEKRHPFRDGQYFYQVTGDFAKQRPESRSGWFASKRRDLSSSIPSTPMSETMRDSPRPEKSRSSSKYEDGSTDSGATTPTTGPIGKKPRVALSKVMKYDVDHRKRSYRPERINLHYDRLHNPDNCYHIRIDWLGVTAKLIEDAIESWAAMAERYGLRLVEAPIGEACSITSTHPFRSPYIVELAVQPPDQQPKTYFDIGSFGPQVRDSPANRHYYQKAVMKKFNFVLDIEAARNFPSNVDVSYSWGKPDFKYTQFIHRSGVVLAQITDEGSFLLLANRLYNNRTAAAREWDRYVKVDHAERNVRMASSVYNHGVMSEKQTPVNSPMLRPVTTNHIGSPTLRATSDVLGPSLAGSKLATIVTPETIKTELETFCQNPTLLEAFYKEVLEKSTPPSATPPMLRSPFVGSLLDSNIPTLGLPPGVLTRDASPSPMRLSGQSGVGSPMPPFTRRQSVQLGFSGVGDAKQGVDSPRGSISNSESDKTS